MTWGRLVLSLDPDLEAALDGAFERLSPPQSEQFQRRFRQLVENALIANHDDADVRRVLELISVDLEGDG